MTTERTIKRTRARPSTGRRTTLRVPPEAEEEVTRLMTESGLTRGAAVQQLILDGAETRRLDARDREAGERIEWAAKQPPVNIPGYATDEEIEAAMRWVREQ